MLNIIQADIFDKQETIIAIVDYITYTGADIVEHLSIRYTVNTTSVVPYLSLHVIPLSDYDPVILRDLPQITNSTEINLSSRTISAIIPYL